MFYDICRAWFWCLVWWVHRKRAAMCNVHKVYIQCGQLYSLVDADVRETLGRELRIWDTQ